MPAGRTDHSTTLIPLQLRNSNEAGEQRDAGRDAPILKRDLCHRPGIHEILHLVVFDEVPEPGNGWQAKT